MNKNDFYRELFEKYALDQDKIRLDALKAGRTPAWKRAVGEYWKPAAGIAAAVAVTVGVVAYTTSNPPGLDITVSDSTALSASERLHEAELNYYRDPGDYESRVDIYVTFKVPMSYTDVSVAFSAVRDDNDIDVTALYLSDGELINDSDEIHSYAENNGGDKTIGGVKIVASAECYPDIQDLSSVYLAELGSDKINDETFTLMPVEDNDPLSGDITAAAETAETTVFSFEAVQTEETTVQTTAATLETSLAAAQSDSAEITDTTAAPVQTDAQDSAETTVPPVQDDTSGDGDTRADDSGDASITSAQVTDALTEAADTEYEGADSAESAEGTDRAEMTETDNSDSGSVEDTDDVRSDDEIEPEYTVEITEEIDDSGEEIDDPDTVYETSAAPNRGSGDNPGGDSSPIPGLMTQLYQINVQDSCAALLVKNYVVVLTRDKAYFYSVGGVLESREREICDVINPKISYSDDNMVIVTGCSEDNLRNIMIVLDTADGSVTVNDVSSNLGDAEIGTINYSESENKFYIKAINASYTHVYETEINNQAADGEEIVSFRPLFEFSGAVSLAGEHGHKLYYTASGDNVTYSLYSFDCGSGATEVISTFESCCRIKRSPSFRSFIISVSEEEGDRIYVFDTQNEKLISTDLSGTEPRIAVSGGAIYLECDGKVYSLAEDGTLTETQGRMIQFTKELRTDYIILESDSEKIIISEKGARW